MGVFKAYDIRGIWNAEWTQELAYRIGRNLPVLLKTDRILVGRDVRLSSDLVFQSLAAGIADSGADVDDGGLATTPLIYWTTARKGYRASVQITASHNPPEYNGLKISRENALPVGGETGLKDLEAMCAVEPGPPNAQRGRIQSIDIKTDYFEFLLSKLPEETAFSNLKLAVDLSNGMAGLFIPELLGPDVEYLNKNLDGNFPGHEPNPLEEKNRLEITELVKKGGYDVGVIFDGDADRVMFLDELGEFVSPDLITALLARPFLDKEPVPVLVDIRTSRAVQDDVEARGGSVTYWKVGHAFAKLKIRELNAPVGGELAGHYYFRDFYWCDSGILAAFLVLTLIQKEKKNGLSFSDILKPLRKYFQSGEMNLKIKDKEGAISAIKQAVLDKETPDSIMDFDGIRMNFKRWWFNVRVSQTEPFLRVVVEADTRERLEESVAFLRSILRPFETVEKEK